MTLLDNYKSARYDFIGFNNIKTPEEIALESIIEVANDNGDELNLDSIIGEHKVPMFVDGGELKDLPREIAELKNLDSLNVSGNLLKYLPNEIGALNKLKYLDVSENMLEELPDVLGQLSNLEALNLAYNNISVLPKSLLKLHHLQYLDLSENPLPIPPEILSKTDEPETILNYYFSITEKKKERLGETKIIVVGQGGVGKTSIVNRLIENTFDDKESKTEGIDIRYLQFRASDNIYKINIWDFGGQEIMHATHQFFLTKRSLYVLVVDSRLSQEAIPSPKKLSKKGFL